MRIISGKNPVKEAIRTQKAEKVYISKNLKNKDKKEIENLSERHNIKKIYVDDYELDKISDTRVHQGVAAEAKDFEYSSIEESIRLAEDKGEKPFFVILDQITDVNNLGAIIRSAECSGVHGVVIPKHRSAKINETVSKTSAGAVEFVNIIQVTNLNRIIEDLKEKGFWVYGADMNGDKYYYEEDYSTPVALVIGSEGSGISRLVRENCDIIVEIPMNGKINSLNASSAASILMFEIMKKRKINES